MTEKPNKITSVKSFDIFCVKCWSRPCKKPNSKIHVSVLRGLSMCHDPSGITKPTCHDVSKALAMACDDLDANNKQIEELKVDADHAQKDREIIVSCLENELTAAQKEIEGLKKDRNDWENTAGRLSDANANWFMRMEDANKIIAGLKNEMESFEQVAVDTISLVGKQNDTIIERAETIEKENVGLRAEIEKRRLASYDLVTSNGELNRIHSELADKNVTLRSEVAELKKEKIAWAEGGRYSGDVKEIVAALRKKDEKC